MSDFLSWFLVFS